MWCRQDVATSHFSVAARECANNDFLPRWIGKRVAIQWPVVLVTLYLLITSCGKVYLNKHNNIHNRTFIIKEEFERIAPEVMQNVVELSATALLLLKIKWFSVSTSTNILFCCNLWNKELRILLKTENPLAALEQDNN